MGPGRVVLPLLSLLGAGTTHAFVAPPLGITKPTPTTVLASTAAPSPPPVRTPSGLGGTTNTWSRDDWVKGFETARTETSYEIVNPTIPKDLEGTLFRNGHAKFDVDGLKIAHPFDGDGMISAITFKDGRAFFRNRFVDTEGYKQELRSKKIEYRGTFGTQKPGGWLANIFDTRRKNVANTNVVFWGDRLLALWEGGLPHLMDPLTLQTYGESRLGKTLKRGQNLGAHPRYDPATDRYVFFSTDPDPVRGKTKTTVFEFDNQFKLVAERTETFDGFALVHDMVITEQYYVFFKAPTTLSPLPWLLGQTGVASCIKFQDDQPAMAYLIPRNNPGKPMVEIAVDPHFSFHFANAYDDAATGEVVVDIIRVPKLYLTDTNGVTGNPIWLTVDYEQDVPKSTLWRYRLNPATRAYTAAESWGVYCDFPSVAPAVTGRPYRYTYLAAGRDPNLPTPVGVVAKFDVEEGKLVDSWRAEPHEFISECVVVPKPQGQAEDDAYLMVYVFNGQTELSQCLIFDAKAVGKGPVSRLQLNSNIPLSLHGSWSNKAVFEGEDILRKFTLFTGLRKFGKIESGMAPIFEI